MKTLIRRFLNEESVALGVIAAAVTALGEAFLGDGLQASDLPVILGFLGFGAAARNRP